jgi:hypothetical protein
MEEAWSALGCCRPLSTFYRFRITSITACGCDSITTWLLATSVVVAPMRLARKRSQSGWIVRSFLATMYQLGFDLHAVPPTFAANRSGAGTHWVAQTSFFSWSRGPLSSESEMSLQAPAVHSYRCKSRLHEAASQNFFTCNFTCNDSGLGVLART